MPDADDDGPVRCADCGNGPVVGERLLGMTGDTEVVEPVCYDHLPQFEVNS